MSHSRINKDMTIAEILQQYPKSREVFIARKMGCTMCFASALETLEQVALMHGIEVQKLVEELNAVCLKEESE